MRFHVAILSAVAMGLAGLGPVSAQQQPCATDALHAAVMAGRPQVAHTQHQHEQRLRLVLDHDAGFARGGGLITVPVVVHVVHDGGSENLPDATVIAGIAQLNDAFANAGPSFDPDGHDMGIRFCLAQRDPQGSATTGIEHIQSPLTDVVAETQDAPLKLLSHWDPLSYINLYVVREITSTSVGSAVAGYAFLPGMHGQPQDGAVVEAAYLGGSIHNTKVTVHELGHYLGLYHTFDGGCGNADCLSDGDRVCDTPPDDATASVACTATVNSCFTDADDSSPNNPFRPVGLGGLGDQNDLFADYMDYGEKVCQTRFTAGQGDRMVATLQTTRSSLLASQGCSSPCPIPFTAAFTLSPASPVPVGALLDLIDQSTPGTSYLWTLDGDTLATTPNASTSFTQEGFHTALLTVRDSVNNCVDDASQLFEVDCPGEASFTASDLEVLPGDTVWLTNTSTGGTPTWYLDGAVYGSAWDTVFVVPQPGVYSIYLTTTSAVCTNTSTTVSITTGNCRSWGPEMNWFFADSASLHFATGTVMAGSASAMYCWEGTATMSDADGELLCYSNGLNIWDRTHTVMPNGSGLLGGGTTSSVNQAIIVPWPGSSTEYCLVTMDEMENWTSHGVRWNKVDMSLNGGLGDITIKNQLLHTQGKECMGAAYHSNGTDIWFLFPRTQPSRIEAWLLTANGFQPPVITVIPNSDNILRPTFSHAAKRVVMCWRTPFPFIHSWHLFDFDAAAGTLSNQLDFSFVGINYLMSAEFSPDDQVLYMSDFDGIHQYDLTQTTASAIQASKFTLPGSFQRAHMRLAPDGRIYDSGNILSQFVGVIQTPEQLGAGCGYVSLGPPLGSGRGELSLPLFVRGARFRGDIALVGPDSACTTGTADIAVEQPDTACAYTWWVNEALVPPTAGDTLLTLAWPGTDSAVVRVDKACPCGYTVGTHVLHYAPPPTYTLGPDTAVCTGQALVLDAGPGASHTWSTGSTQQTTTITAAGEVWVELIDGNGCVLRDTVQVVEVPYMPPVELGAGDTLCMGQVLVLDAGPGYQSYLWQDLSSAQTFTAWLPGTYWVTVTSACGTTTDTVQVVDAGTDLVDLGPDTVVCDNTPVQLQVSGLLHTILWNDGSAGTVLSVNPPALAWVEVTDERGCAERDSLLVQVDTVPPVLICPRDTVVVGGEVGPVFVSLEPAVAFDDCAVTVANDVNGTVDASGMYAPGTTVVTWTAVDQAGNVTLCTAVITVAIDNAVADVGCAGAARVVPNPTSGPLTLRVPCLRGRARAALINALGQQVTGWWPVDGEVHPLNVDGLAPGAYTLRLVEEGGERRLPVLVVR